MDETPRAEAAVFDGLQGDAPGVFFDRLAAVTARGAGALGALQAAEALQAGVGEGQRGGFGAQRSIAGKPWTPSSCEISPAWKASWLHIRFSTEIRVWTWRSPLGLIRLAGITLPANGDRT